jgi:hypothetical protein
MPIISRVAPTKTAPISSRADDVDVIDDLLAHRHGRSIKVVRCCLFSSRRSLFSEIFFFFF